MAEWREEPLPEPELLVSVRKRSGAPAGGLVAARRAGRERSPSQKRAFAVEQPESVGPAAIPGVKLLCKDRGICREGII